MISLVAQPALSIQSNRLSIVVLSTLRMFFLAFFIFALNQSTPLGASPLVISLGAAVGVVVATLLAFTNLRMIGFGLFVCGSYFFYEIIFATLSLLPPRYLGDVFSIYTLQTHSQLVLTACLVAAVSSWAFWRSAHTITLELLALIGLSVYLGAEYRNFNFRVSQSVGSLAWYLGISHLSTLVALGALFVIAVMLYLFLATLPSKPVAALAGPRNHADAGKKRVLASTAVLLIFGSVLLIVSQLNLQYFSIQSESLVSNGVGQASEEKVSPLGFHSALGGTNQPSGLVRLEGDYPTNPFSPMLYLRESALSDFDGLEFVTAERRYDTDVSHNRPDEVFVGEEDSELMTRTPLMQSVYLLSEHKLAFAVDYPISINLLKNPNPNRFKAAYRAYSIAPAFSLQSLREAQVGDHRWNEETRKHYLVTHPDQRYLALAREIGQGMVNPIDQAFAITNYLSKNAIYTLTPGHELKAGEDPVAPFLFGDMRGYCVHFAHATVYLLRALGIPARIGTGYLTDLSQAKDGHILLRMSDRHAWAEVYVDGKGWLPFDTKPEQVESHAETPVDMKLLEELMDMLGPGEEILPRDITKHEPGAALDEGWKLPDLRWLLTLGVLAVMSIITMKVYLLYGWLMPGSPSRTLRRFYRALLCRLYDLGYQRKMGETRLEFRSRMSKELGIDMLACGEVMTRVFYASHSSDPLTTSQVRIAGRSDLGSWACLTGWKRAFATINPASVFGLLFGRNW